MPPRRRAQSGFTLIELLITLTLMAVLLLLAVAPLDKFMHRGKIEGIARQTATLMQLARFEAIKRSVPARVVVDTSKHEVYAYAELTSDDDYDPGLDREIGRYPVPDAVDFKANTGTEDDDNALLNLLGSAPHRYAEFEIDGAVEEHPDGTEDGLPAIRFADQRGNLLEVDVATRATGRVELRKWQNGDYRLQGENGQSWEWF